MELEEIDYDTTINESQQSDNGPTIINELEKKYSETKVVGLQTKDWSTFDEISVPISPIQNDNNGTK